MVIQAKTQLVIARALGQFPNPVQGPHMAKPRLDTQHMPLFAGSRIPMDFQPRQVTYFSTQRATSRLGESDFPQSMPGTVVEITLGIVGPILTRDHRDAAQLIANVPTHFLAAQQFPLIAIGIEDIRQIAFLSNTAIAVGRGKHLEGFHAAVVAGLQIPGGVVIEGLGVIAQLIGVQRCGLPGR
ncbi:hypothetical protein D3C71_1241170 [compost metagenome]